MSRYENINFIMISPEELRLPDYIIKDVFEKKNNIAAENRDLINRAIAILDREYQPAPGFQALRYKAPEQVAE